MPAGELNGEFLSFPGLTDKMRSDFVIMKALHDHTKLNPEQREGRLSGFVSKIQKYVGKKNSWTPFSFFIQLLIKSPATLDEALFGDDIISTRININPSGQCGVEQISPLNKVYYELCFQGFFLLLFFCLVFPKMGGKNHQGRGTKHSLSQSKK